MNVWIVADVGGTLPGGMRRHMELHAEGLRRLGQRATTFFSEDLRGGAAAWAPRRLPGVRSFLALRARAALERPDVVNVHTQCAPAWIVAARSGKIASRVIVMSYAADERAVQVKQPRDVLRWIRAALPARSTFPHADGLWCVNRTDVEYYRARYGVPAAKLACLPHAVADAFYRRPSEERRRPYQVLFAGTWILRKGIDVLAAALDAAVERLPELEIALAGTLIDDAAVRRALTPRVLERTRHLSTATDAELRALYHQSSLLLLPSRSEGLPIVMLEAMACGCPTLAAANSGMLDAIEPGKNGWLEGSFEPSRWAARIVEILREPEAVVAASRAAVESAESYRIETVAGEVLEWYRRLGGVANRSHGAR